MEQHQGLDQQARSSSGTRVVDAETYELLFDILRFCPIDSPVQGRVEAWLRESQVAQEDELSVPAIMNLKDCNECGCPMFFARTVNSRTPTKVGWVPFVPRAIRVAGRMLDASYINFEVGPGGLGCTPNVVTSTKANNPDIKWVPHRVFCGKPRPEDPVLGQLYDQTDGLVAMQTEGTIEMMRKLNEI